MKKISVILVFLLLVLNFCSCFGKSKTEIQCEEVVRCFNERDSEGLKELFCAKVINSTLGELDDQIKVFFDRLGTETIVSYNWSGGSSETSYSKGKITSLESTPDIEIDLSNGDKIYLFYWWYQVNDESPDEVGISQITITYNGDTELEEEYKIGKVSLIHSRRS